MAKSHFDIIDSMNRSQAHLNHALRVMKKKENNMPKPGGFEEPSDNQLDNKDNKDNKKRRNQSNEIKPLDVRSSYERLQHEKPQEELGSNQQQRSDPDLLKGRPEDQFDLSGNLAKMLYERRMLTPGITKQLEAQRLEKEPQSKADVRAGTDKTASRDTLSPEQQKEQNRKFDSSSRSFESYMQQVGTFIERSLRNIILP